MYIRTTIHTAQYLASQILVGATRVVHPGDIVFDEALLGRPSLVHPGRGVGSSMPIHRGCALALRCLPPSSLSFRVWNVLVLHTPKNLGSFRLDFGLRVVILPAAAFCGCVRAW